MLNPMSSSMEWSKMKDVNTLFFAIAQKDKEVYENSFIPLISYARTTLLAKFVWEKESDYRLPFSRFALFLQQRGINGLWILPLQTSDWVVYVHDDSSAFSVNVGMDSTCEVVTFLFRAYKSCNLVDYGI